MEVYYDIQNSLEKTAVILGFFDGVHKGHLSVIQSGISYAKSHNLKSAVFTFDKNPRLEFNTSNPNATNIITNNDKLKILSEIGVDRIYFVPFSKIKDIEPVDFFNNILVKTLHSEYISCGFNYHFGKNGKGDITLLKKLCDKNNIIANFSQPVKYKNEFISSTRIRNALKDGNINLVNELLGRNFSFTAKVIHGKALGRTINIPTINQIFENNFAVMKFGVYVTAAIIDNKKYYGVTNIGVKPTVTNKNNVICETWFPDFNGNLYDREITLLFYDFIRKEHKFSNINELKMQILKDKEVSELIYKKRRNNYYGKIDC